MSPDWGDVPGWIEALATVGGFGGILITLGIDRGLRKRQDQGRLKDSCNELLAIVGTVVIKLDAHRATWMAWSGSGVAPVWGSLRSTSLLMRLFGAPAEVTSQPTRIFRSPREAEAAAQLLTGITDQLMRAGMVVRQFQNEEISDAAWKITEAANDAIGAYDKPASVREEKSDALLAAMAELRRLADQL